MQWKIPDILRITKENGVSVYLLNTPRIHQKLDLQIRMF